MATITATPLDAPDRTRKWRRDRMRAALAQAWRKGTAMASAARHPSKRSPALTIGGFICIDTSAFQLAAGHLSPGIGLLVTGISAWLFDWSLER